MIIIDWSSCKVPVILATFSMKQNFSLHIFEKCSNIKFNVNPFSGGRGVPSGRTDEQDKANSRFPKFWNAPKNER